MTKFEIKTTKDFHDLFMNTDQEKFEELFLNGNEGKKWVDYDNLKKELTGIEDFIAGKRED